MFIRATEIVGGAVVMAAAGVYVAFQAAAAPDLIKELGLPIAFLLITLGALRILWKANEKKDEKLEKMVEKMEIMSREFSTTVKSMSAEHSAAFADLTEEFRNRRRTRA